MQLFQLRNLVQWTTILQEFPCLPPGIENASSTGDGVSRLPQLQWFPGPDSASLTKLSPAAGDNSYHSGFVPVLPLWAGSLLKQLQYVFCAGPAAGGRIPILILIPQIKELHVNCSDRSLQITSSNKRWNKTLGCNTSSPHKYGEEPSIEQGRQCETGLLHWQGAHTLHVIWRVILLCPVLWNCESEEPTETHTARWFLCCSLWLVPVWLRCPVIFLKAQISTDK